jgi:hypothetical protein
MLILECSQGCYAVIFFTRWPWKSIGFQILLRTKYVPSLVKIHWRMLILECSILADPKISLTALFVIPSPTKLRRDIVTLPSFHNILVNTRINILQWILTKLGTYLVLKRIWNPIDFQGHRVKYLRQFSVHFVTYRISSTNNKKNLHSVKHLEDI